MHPCAVCGSVAINANGHCAQCGTYRGMPGQAAGPAPSSFPGQPGYPPPFGGAPAHPHPGPVHPPGAGVPGYPQPGSGPGFPPPGGGPGFPTSAPPVGYPTSGGGYPGGYLPPSPPRPGRPFLVPLVALASTLAVLVIAIILVVSLREDEPTTPVADPSTATPPIEQTSANPRIDPCVVGTWRITSHREEVNSDELGKLVFTGGEGGRLELKRDGSGEADYGSGTSYTADAKGQEIRLQVLGVVSFRYTTVDGTVSMTDVDSHATFQFFIDDEQYGDTEPFDVTETPSDYTCSGDSMTHKTLLFTTEYERVG